MTAGNFWDSGIWSTLLLFGLLFAGVILANSLKQKIGFLRRSLIPSSVLGGLILLAVSTVCRYTTGTYLFDFDIFCSGSAYSGIGVLESVTYHCLAIGFICMTLRRTGRAKDKGRTGEVFDSGALVVSSYLLQATLGLCVTILAAAAVPGLIEGAGTLLAFGFGQGTGQALNFGATYENDYGFVGGKSFGLTVAAMGFLVATTVGVIYLNILRRQGKLKYATPQEGERKNTIADYEENGEFPLTESVDKLTLQVAIVLLIYLFAYGLMVLLGRIVGQGLMGTVYGFNFLLGTVAAIIFKAIYTPLRRRGTIKREYINNFMMNRISGFAFDVMIVAGIGAIKIDVITAYWPVLLVLAVLGTLFTILYVSLICKRLFPSYRYEQFLAFYGMLTGTASTGMILLREADPDFRTPASENVVYHTIPAIVFGFPMMFIASYAPRGKTEAIISLLAVIAMFVFMNLVLFRRKIFRRKIFRGKLFRRHNKAAATDATDEVPKAK